MITGKEDNIWNSYDGCLEILDNLKKNNYKYNVELLICDKMGHPIPVPYIIPIGETLSMNMMGGVFSSGGTMKVMQKDSLNHFNFTKEIFSMDYSKEIYLLHIMQQTYSSLVSVSNKLQIAGDKYCEPLTSRQYMTMLAVLHLDKDETTFINIAKKLGTTKQNVTQLINSLEKKNFVSIIPSKKDKRSVNVCVTDLGMDAVVKCGKDVTIDFMADIFKDFTKEEIETLWKLLVKLYRFDDVAMDGFEKSVKIPNVDIEDDLIIALEKFSNRRSK